MHGIISEFYYGSGEKSHFTTKEFMCFYIRLTGRGLISGDIDRHTVKTRDSVSVSMALEIGYFYLYNMNTTFYERIHVVFYRLTPGLSFYVHIKRDKLSIGAKFSTNKETDTRHTEKQGKTDTQKNRMTKHNLKKGRCYFC